MNETPISGRVARSSLVTEGDLRISVESECKTSDPGMIEPFSRVADRFSEWCGVHYPPGDFAASLTRHEHGVVISFLVWLSRGGQAP
jgi:hypothetical protein